MSLINEALRQAKQNQQATPAPPLEFKPVEPGQRRARHSTLLVIGFTIVLIAVAGLTVSLAWFVAQRNSPALHVQAATLPKPPAVTNSPATKPAPIIKPPVTVSDDSTSDIAAEVSVKNIQATESSTSEPAKVIAEIPKPAGPKLQGIFFDPKNPSALVNGKPVFLGERVGAYFVLGISPTTVTLASATATNVLSLSE